MKTLMTTLQRTRGREWVEWREVLRMAREAGLTESCCRILVRGNAAAKKYLPGRQRHVYLRGVVLESLGLVDEPPGPGNL
jgi:hypothetical protein